MAVMVVVAVVLILPPCFRADDLVIRVSWDEKAEMCRLCIEQKFPFCAR
jgi:hypothetical protein